MRHAILLALALSVAAAGHVMAADPVAVGGSTTVKPLVERAVKALKVSQPELSFTVSGGGSGAAVKGLVDGKFQVGALSRDLKDKEKEALPEVVATPIALDGLAVVVNAGAGVSALTKQQIVDLYTGKVTNWKDAGGGDVPVALVTVSEVNGTYDLFLSSFQLKEKAATGGVVLAVDKTDAFGSAIATVANTIQEAVLAVQKNKGGICALSIGTAANAIHKGLDLKIASLDGVEANAANVLSGAYPYRRTLILATKGAPSAGGKALIDWLVGSDGQKMVADLEFIPLAGK